LTNKHDALPEAKEFNGKPNKLELLSREPGKGDWVAIFVGSGWLRQRFSRRYRRRSGI